MSCNKGDCSRLVRMAKQIAFWNGERVQSIHIDVNEPKGISSEVPKSLDVSLRHIYTSRFNGEITLLLGQTIDYDGGNIIEILYGELKNVGSIFSFYRITNSFLNS